MNKKQAKIALKLWDNILKVMELTNPEQAKAWKTLCKAAFKGDETPEQKVMTLEVLFTLTDIGKQLKQAQAEAKVATKQ